ncbi:MAG: hypothetical protein FJ087_07245 [Deltaproteobacteria bacterium]|nr:hypothetical protein [Deltaproteobacteria bacterium]
MRALPIVVAAACLLAAPAEAKKKAPAKPAKKAAKKAPAPPPEPDPLAGAWTGGAKGAQLGNGSLASEVLVSALRLVGLRGSFDEDSFIRHVLYVNAIAARDDLPADDWARAFARRLASKGVVKRDRVPRKGDVVLFSLNPASPGKASGRVLAGVVDSATKTRVSFLAPVGDRVVRGSATLLGKAGAKDTPILACGGKDAAAPATGKGTGKGKGKGKAKKPSPAAPCRAGDLLIGTADLNAVARSLGSYVAER